MKNAGPSFFYTSRPYKVIICIVTIWSFLFNTVFQGIGIQDLAWAQRSDLGFTGVGPKIGSGPGRNMTRLLNPEAFNMPSYLGQVKHIASCNSRKIIFHIQDAHCNYPAQLKIAEIIDYLAREYDIKLVNLEGGEGEYDLSIFTDIQNRKLRKKVSDYFLKHGEINGAEFFAINNPDRVRLYGIEDAEHYIENLNAYRKTLKLKPGIDKGLKDLSQIIDSLKTKIYSEKLLELDRKYEDYKHRELDFKTYVSYLVDESRGRGVNLKKFENIYLLDKVFELEKDINFKKCNRERDAILDKLQKMLSKLEVQELVKKVLDFKLGSITQTEFYTYLTRKVKELNIELGMSSNLKLYIGYITIYESIDKDMVFAELEGLEDAVKETLFESGFQRQLNTLSRRLEIIKGISDISLTRDEYRIYLARRDEFKLRNFTSFIQKEAPKYNTPSRIEKDIEGLDRYLNKMQDFYRCADRRDLAFVENSKWIMGASKADMAIMISGGFHTDGLKELCKRNNISYIAILPNFRNGNGYKSPYFELLSGGSSPLTDYIYTHQSSIAIASYLTVMAGKHDVLGYPKIQAFKGAVEVAKWFFNEEGDKEGPFTYDLVDRGNIITTIEFSRTGREGQMIPGTEDFPIYARDTGIGAQLALKGRSESEATAERIPPERFNTNDLRRALVVFITMACLAYSSGPIHRGAHYARRSATGTRASATGVASDDRSEVINLEPAEMIGLSVKEFDTFGESEIPPTGPPVDDERIRELYSADRRFIDGTPLTDEMILQAVRDKAKELSQDPTLSETERGALYGQLTEIEGWITGHDKRHYTDIYALARASAAYLSQIAESGFSVHFPRDGGYFYLIEDTLMRLDGKERALAITYYLSRKHMVYNEENYYDKVNKMVTDASAIALRCKDDAKRKEIFQGEFLERFHQLMESDEAFREFVEQERSRLEGLGLFSYKNIYLIDIDNMYLVDTGYDGTMPWFVWAIIQLYKRDHPECENLTAEPVLFSSQNLTRQLDPERDMDVQDRKRLAEHPETQGYVISGVDQICMSMDGNSDIAHPIGYDKDSHMARLTDAATRLKAFYIKLLFMKAAIAHHNGVLGISEAEGLGIELSEVMKAAIENFKFTTDFKGVVEPTVHAMGLVKAIDLGNVAHQISSKLSSAASSKPISTVFHKINEPALPWKKMELEVLKLPLGVKLAMKLVNGLGFVNDKLFTVPGSKFLLRGIKILFVVLPKMVKGLFKAGHGKVKKEPTGGLLETPPKADSDDTRKSATGVAAIEKTTREIRSATLEEVRAGLQESQYDMSDFTYEDPLISDSIATHPAYIYMNEAGDRIVLKGGPTHTVIAEYIAQRFYTLLGCDTPRMSLERHEEQPKLAIQYLDPKKYSMLTRHFPEDLRDSINIQRGIIASLLVYDYDRTPWNFMYDEGAGKVVFIDFGASLCSRAQGGKKGFPDSIDDVQIKDVMTNPQFGGVINDAYANMIGIDDDGRIIVRPAMRQVMRQLADMLRAVTDQQIDAIIDEAFTRAGVTPEQSKIMLSDWESFLRETLQDGDNIRLKQAKDTLEAIRGLRETEGSDIGIDIYYKHALKGRRDSLVARFAGKPEGEPATTRPLLARASVTGTAVLAEPDEEIQEPLIDNPIQWELANMWAEAHPTKALQELARFILENITHITYGEFVEALQSTVNDFNSKFEEPYVVLMGEELGKSDRWVYDIARALGLREPEAVGDLSEIRKAILEKDVNDVVIIDDASYSGTQISALVEQLITDEKLEGRNITIHVVAPFMTNESIRSIDYRIGTFAADPDSVIIYGHQTIETISEIFQRVESENKDKDFSHLRKLLRKVYKNGDRGTLTYFQHKIPDSFSTLTAYDLTQQIETYNINNIRVTYNMGVLEGVVVDEEGRILVDKVVPFIRETMQPYKEGYLEWAEGQLHAAGIPASISPLTTVQTEAARASVTGAAIAEAVQGRIPLFDNPIMEDKKEDWIAAHPERLQRLARFIADNITHISFDEFIEALSDTISHFNARCNNRYVALASDGRSSSWVCDVAGSLGLRKPAATGDWDQIKELILTGGVNDIAIIDDASYSGQQARTLIDGLYRNLSKELGADELKRRKIKIHVVMPFMTKRSVDHIARYRLTNNITRYKGGFSDDQIAHYRHRTIYTVREIFENEKVPRSLLQDFVRVYGDETLDQALTYFQHKIPDFMSTVYMTDGAATTGEFIVSVMDGIVVDERPIGENVIGQIRFIPETKPPYQPGYPQWVEGQLASGRIPVEGAAVPAALQQGVSRASATGIAIRHDLAKEEMHKLPIGKDKDAGTDETSGVPPEGPPQSDEDIMRLYSANPQFLDGMPLTDERIIEALTDEADRLANEHPEQEEEIREELSRIEGWIANADREHYTTIYMLARVATAYLSQITESGFSIHFPRDGGYFYLIEDTLMRLEGNSGALAITYYLSRDHMEYNGKNYYRPVRDMIRAATIAASRYKGSKKAAVFRREFKKKFEARMESDDTFRELVEREKKRLEDLGLFSYERLYLIDTDDMYLVDTGFEGTMPWFVWAIIQIYKPESENIEAQPILFASRNFFTPQFGPGDMEPSERERLARRPEAEALLAGSGLGYSMESGRIAHPIQYDENTHTARLTDVATRLRAFYMKLLFMKAAIAHHNGVLGIGEAENLANLGLNIEVPETLKAVLRDFEFKTDFKGLLQHAANTVDFLKAIEAGNLIHEMATRLILTQPSTQSPSLEHQMVVLKEMLSKLNMPKKVTPKTVPNEKLFRLPGQNLLFGLVRFLLVRISNVFHRLFIPGSSEAKRVGQPKGGPLEEPPGEDTGGDTRKSATGAEIVEKTIRRIREATPEEVGAGFQERQFNIDDFTYKEPLVPDYIATHPADIYVNEARDRIILKGGPPHTVIAEYIAQRFYRLLGCNVPDMSLVIHDDQPKLAIQCLPLESYHTIQGNLPAELHDNLGIQMGIMASFLIYDYDRVPWNFMHNPAERKVVFIDFGASLSSRAQGGYKGFPDSIDIVQINDVMTNPQFGGLVNEAYGRLFRFGYHGSIEYMDPLVQMLAEAINAVTDEQIDAIVDFAFDRAERTPEQSRKLLDSWLAKLKEGIRTGITKRPKQAQHTIEAVERLRASEGEIGIDDYYKHAIKRRRDALVRMFPPEAEPPRAARASATGTQAPAKPAIPMPVGPVTPTGPHFAHRSATIARAALMRTLYIISFLIIPLTLCRLLTSPSKVEIGMPTFEEELSDLDTSPIPQLLSKWVKSHPPGRMRELAQFIVDNMDYIDYEDFLIMLKLTVLDFNSKCQEPYVVLLEEKPNKSDRWVLGLAKTLGLREPEAVGTIDKIKPYILKNGIRDVVIIDDASYSGMQVNTYIDALFNKKRGIGKKVGKDEIKIHLVLPFLCDANIRRNVLASSQGDTFGFPDENLKVYAHYNIPTVEEIFARIYSNLQRQEDKEHLVGLMALMREAYPGVYSFDEGLDNRTLFCLAHKKPDGASVPEAVDGETGHKMMVFQGPVVDVVDGKCRIIYRVDFMPSDEPPYKPTQGWIKRQPRDRPVKPYTVADVANMSIDTVEKALAPLIIEGKIIASDLTEMAEFPVAEPELIRASARGKLTPAKLAKSEVIYARQTTSIRTLLLSALRCISLLIIPLAIYRLLQGKTDYHTMPIWAEGAETFIPTCPPMREPEPGLKVSYYIETLQLMDEVDITPGSLATILEGIWREATGREKGAPDLAIVSRFAMALAQNRLCLAIDSENNTVIGFACFETELTDEGEETWLTNIAIRPSYQGKGIAATLMKLVILQMWNKNINIFYFYSLEEARPFYIKFFKHDSVKGDISYRNGYRNKSKNKFIFNVNIKRPTGIPRLLEPKDLAAGITGPAMDEPTPTTRASARGDAAAAAGTLAAGEQVYWVGELFTTPGGKRIQGLRNLEKDVTPIPDVHGDLAALRGYLAGLELITKGEEDDGSKDKLTKRGRQTKMVQMGDVPDRGPDTERILDYFDNLWAQNADLVWLCGNHELIYLTKGTAKGDEYKDTLRYSDERLYNDDGFINRLKGYVENDRLQAAACIGGTIFVHGGLTSGIVELDEFRNTTPEEFVSEVNGIFRENVLDSPERRDRATRSRFQHPIFNLHNEPISGIFNAYFAKRSIVEEKVIVNLNNDMEAAMANRGWRQVVAHSPIPYTNSATTERERKLVATESGNVICVDCLLSSHFLDIRTKRRIKEGGKAALIFKKDGRVFHVKPWAFPMLADDILLCSVDGEPTPWASFLLDGRRAEIRAGRANMVLRFDHQSNNFTLSRGDKSLTVPAGRIHIGRRGMREGSPRYDFVIDDEMSVSGSHLELILLREGRVMFRDLGSTNGSLVIPLSTQPVPTPAAPRASATGTATPAATPRASATGVSTVFEQTLKDPILQGDSLMGVELKFLFKLFGKIDLRFVPLEEINGIIMDVERDDDGTIKTIYCSNQLTAENLIDLLGQLRPERPQDQWIPVAYRLYFYFRDWQAALAGYAKRTDIPGQIKTELVNLSNYFGGLAGRAKRVLRLPEDVEGLRRELPGEFSIEPKIQQFIDRQLARAAAQEVEPESLQRRAERLERFFARNLSAHLNDQLDVALLEGVSAQFLNLAHSWDNPAIRRERLADVVGEERATRIKGWLDETCTEFVALQAANRSNPEKLRDIHIGFARRIAEVIRREFPNYGSGKFHLAKAAEAQKANCVAYTTMFYLLAREVGLSPSMTHVSYAYRDFGDGKNDHAANLLHLPVVAGKASFVVVDVTWSDAEKQAYVSEPIDEGSARVTYEDRALRRIELPRGISRHNELEEYKDPVTAMQSYRYNWASSDNEYLRRADLKKRVAERRLRQNPNDHTALSWLGRYYAEYINEKYEVRDAKRAVGYLQRALRVRVTEVDLSTLQACPWLNENEFSSFCAELLDRHNNVHTYLIIAKSYLRFNKDDHLSDGYKRSILTLERALSKFPGENRIVDALAYYSLAAYLYSGSDAELGEKAIGYTERALRNDPTNGFLWSEYWNVARQRGHSEQYASFCDKLIRAKEKPGFAEPVLALMEYYGRQKTKKGYKKAVKVAQAYLKNPIARRPSLVLRQLRGVYLPYGKLFDAPRWADDRVDGNVFDGKVDEFLRYLQKLNRRLHPRNLPVIECIASTYMEIGEFDEARKYFDYYLKAMGDQARADVRKKLMICLAELKEWDNVLPEAEIVLDHEQDNRYALVLRGKAYQELAGRKIDSGRDAEAFEHYKRARDAYDRYLALGGIKREEVEEVRKRLGECRLAIMVLAKPTRRAVHTPAARAPAVAPRAAATRAAAPATVAVEAATRASVTGKVADISVKKVLTGETTPETIRQSATGTSAMPKPLLEIASLDLSQECEANLAKIGWIIAERPELFDMSLEKVLESIKVKFEEDKEEAELMAEALVYAMNIYRCSMNLLAMTRMPEEPRYIFMPLTEKLSGLDPIIARGKMQEMWKDVRNMINDEYNFSNVTIIFYDGTLEGLERKIEGRTGLTQENALAYVVKGEAEANNALYRSLSKDITPIKEQAQPEGSYISVGAHVTLALGILDLAKNRREDAEYARYVTDLIYAMSGGNTAITPDELMDLIKKDELDKLVITLPAIKEAEINKDMTNFFLSEEAVLKSL